MRTITQKIEELRGRFANILKQNALRANGTATKEYLDYLEGYVVQHDVSCKGCRDYNNGTHHDSCKNCRRYCADLYKEK